MERKKFCEIMVVIFIMTAVGFLGNTVTAESKDINISWESEGKFRVVEFPRAGWISPTGHNDPADAWHDEPYAYDNNTGTKAGCTILEFGWWWTPWIELTLNSPTDISKIRFFAWYDYYHCNEVDVDLYYGGGWHNLYQGSYPDRQWMEYAINMHDVTAARLSFHVQRWLLYPVTADLHEFQFYRVGYGPLDP
ncbi:MAG: hypothetical protein DRO67_09600 [Candidatus Asgardarchaeum californiense]|nr:MAG: hypothetical protein DRO67_09600 [Candidatus Asgardarchaeum californiense]